MNLEEGMASKGATETTDQTKWVIDRSKRELRKEMKANEKSDEDINYIMDNMSDKDWAQHIGLQK